MLDELCRVQMIAQNDLDMEVPSYGILSHLYPICDADVSMDAAIEFIRGSRSPTNATDDRCMAVNDVERCIEKIVDHAQTLSLPEVYTYIVWKNAV